MSFSSISEQGLADTITVGEYLVKNKESSFMLEMVGDSMTDSGICHGDKIIFERGKIPKGSDIVITLNEEGYKIKYFKQIKNQEQVIGVITSSFRTYG